MGGDSTIFCIHGIFFPTMTPSIGETHNLHTHIWEMEVDTKSSSIDLHTVFLLI